MMTRQTAARACALVAVLGLAAACGGGGGGGQIASGSTSSGGGGGLAPPSTQSPGGSGTGGSTGPTYTRGSYAPSGTLAAQCAQPRTGNDPDTGKPWPDKAGSALAEKLWLRSWTNELYLWYAEVPDLDPSATADVRGYFDLLKTPAVTATGAKKDRFHFWYTTAEWDLLSKSGTTANYGVAWDLVAGAPGSPPRIVIAYVEPGSTASSLALTRGMELTALDGTAVDLSTRATGQPVLDVIYPETAGQSHSFGLKARDGSTRVVTLAAVMTPSTPVMNVKVLPGGVGYLQFNDHIQTSEAALVGAINQLKSSGVGDLVIDLRYNGGGYLAIASELAYMVGGSKVSGKLFERQQFNTRYPDTLNPVTNSTLTPVPFLSQAQGFSVPSGQALPTLNLPRVVVLTGEGTCSASESIINGLRGGGVQVIQVGETTCGKPYGFYPTDNCGTTYFTIQFRGVNAAGFGDYADGFSPTGSGGDPATTLPGCAAADDFQHDLGDPAEGRLAGALGYLANGQCPAAVSSAPGGPRALAATAAGEEPAFRLPPRPWRENRILGGP